MSCPKFEQYGLLYQSGELAENEGAIFKDHVKNCAYCQEELSTAGKIINRLKSVPLLTPSGNCLLRIGHNTKIPAQPKSLYWKYLTWAGASIAAVILLTFVRITSIPTIPGRIEVTIPIKQRVRNGPEGTATEPPKTAKFSEPEIPEWKNGIDQEISLLKYKIAYFSLETTPVDQTNWDPIKQLEKNINRLVQEIEKM